MSLLIIPQTLQDSSMTVRLPAALQILLAKSTLDGI